MAYSKANTIYIYKYYLYSIYKPVLPSYYFLNMLFYMYKKTYILLKQGFKNARSDIIWAVLGLAIRKIVYLNLNLYLLGCHF